MEFEQIKNMTDGVDGFLSHEEGELLNNAAKSCTGKGTIVEIGSWKGKSTIWMGHGSKNGSGVRIFAIDPHTGTTNQKEILGTIWTFEEFKNNIKNASVDDLVTPIVKTSEEAARDFSDPVELVFIDGDHDYKFVKADFDLWFPKLINGGLMAFHDSGKAGPKKVLEDLVYRSENFRNIVTVDSITMAQKVEQNSAVDRIKNKYYLRSKSFCESVSRIGVPKPLKAIGRKIFVPRPRFS
jgi:predicted O-methyltransferase YrrM